MQYRKDINGLRAYAVLIVVLYHFWPNVLPGGFVGVDVFFVISGYLMTGIVLTGLKENTFKLTTFYIARIDRIVPALAALLIVIMCIGWYFLPKAELNALSDDVLSSLFFVSNILYSLDSGYFSTHSLDRWLLHTWSLSVEWQYYLLFPLALILAKKIFKVTTNKVIWISVIITVLIYSIYLSNYSPLKAFFYLQSRAWELLAGGLVYLLSIRLSFRTSKVVEMLGLALIIASAIVFNKWKLWPGYLALIPVIGTCFILIANVKQSIFTHNAVFQYIGKRSYSLYLWHWPVVVAMNYWGNNNVALQILAFLSTFIMASLSFKYIEKKLISTKFYTNNKKSIYLTLIILSVAYFTSIKFNENNNNNNQNKMLSEVLAQQIMPSVDNGYCFKDFNHGEGNNRIELTTPCFLGLETSKSKVLLFGDSFAGQYDPMFAEFALTNNIKIDSVTTNWCHPSFNSGFFPNQKQHPSYAQCMLNRKYLENQLDSYEVVILSAAWASIFSRGHTEEVESVIEMLITHGKHVYLLPSATSYDLDILKKFRVLSFNNLPFDTARFSKNNDKSVLLAHNYLTSLANKYDSVSFIKRTEIYDITDQFRVGEYNVPYSLDGSHISLLGSKALATNFIKSKYAKDIIQQIK